MRSFLAKHFKPESFERPNDMGPETLPGSFTPRGAPGRPQNGAAPASEVFGLEMNCDCFADVILRVTELFSLRRQAAESARIVPPRYQSAGFTSRDTYGDFIHGSIVHAPLRGTAVELRSTRQIANLSYSVLQPPCHNLVVNCILKPLTCPLRFAYASLLPASS